MKKLVLAVITSILLSSGAHASFTDSVGAAGAASAKFKIASALERVAVVAGKDSGSLAAFTYADKITKKLDKIVIKGIRAKKSCLKIEKDWIAEQEPLVKEESKGDELLYKAQLKVLDAAGDYISSQCLAIK